MSKAYFSPKEEQQLRHGEAMLVRARRAARISTILTQSRMKKLIKLLSNSRRRESLYWNLKRVYVEHLYWEKLRHLCFLIDSIREDIDNGYTDHNEEYRKKIQDALKELREGPYREYLEPELIRLETLASFISGEA